MNIYKTLLAILLLLCCFGCSSVPKTLVVGTQVVVEGHKDFRKDIVLHFSNVKSYIEEPSSAKAEVILHEQSRILKTFDACGKALGKQLEAIRKLYNGN